MSAKHAERHALLRHGFLLSALGGLLCTVPLPIHAAEFRTDGGRSIPDRELLPEVSDCAEMIREAVSEPMETTGRRTKGEVFLPATEAVSAYGIQPDPPKSESDEKPAEREIEVRLLVTREKQKTEGARISVVGTDRQTETNAEGLARLFVKPGSTIRITYPGCQPQEKKIYNTFNAYRQFALISLKPESNTAEAQKTQRADDTEEADADDTNDTDAAVEIYAPGRCPDGTSAENAPDRPTPGRETARLNPLSTLFIPL